MASLGQLSAGVAHEINNPVGYLLSNMSSLHEYFETMITLFNHYQILEESIHKKDITTIKQQMKKIVEFKDQEDLDFILQDLSVLVESSADGLKRVKDIVHGLKRFSHSGDDENEYFNINECIEESLSLVWNQIKFNAEVKKEIIGNPLSHW